MSDSEAIRLDEYDVRLSRAEDSYTLQIETGGTRHELDIPATPDQAAATPYDQFDSLYAALTDDS